MKNTNTTALKFTGIIMIVFAIVYAIVGTLALIGTVNGALPGHESQETLVVVLAYAVALFALICGVACVKAAVCRPARLARGGCGGLWGRRQWLRP